MPYAAVLDANVLHERTEPMIRSELDVLLDRIEDPALREGVDPSAKAG